MTVTSVTHRHIHQNIADTDVMFCRCGKISARYDYRLTGLKLIDGHRWPWPSVPLLLAVMPLKILGYFKKRVPFSHLAVMPLRYYVCPFAWP